MGDEDFGEPVYLKMHSGFINSNNFMSRPVMLKNDGHDGGVFCCTFVRDVCVFCL